MKSIAFQERIVDTSEKAGISSDESIFEYERILNREKRARLLRILCALDSEQRWKFEELGHFNKFISGVNDFEGPGCRIKIFKHACYQINTERIDNLYSGRIENHIFHCVFFNRCQEFFTEFFEIFRNQIDFGY